MERIILGLIIVGALALSFTHEQPYAVRVMQNEHILHEVKVQSQAKVDSMLEVLARRFPQADSMEVEALSLEAALL